MNDHVNNPQDERSGADQRPRREASVKAPSLRPVHLKQEQERRVEEKRLEARKVSLSRLADQAPAARVVDARSYAYQPVEERRPEMRVESSRDVTLREIAISGAAMQNLRELRVASRDLGLVVPGKRIRVGPTS